MALVSINQPSRTNSLLLYPRRSGLVRKSNHLRPIYIIIIFSEIDEKLVREARGQRTMKETAPYCVV